MKMMRLIQGLAGVGTVAVLVSSCAMPPSRPGASFPAPVESGEASARDGVADIVTGGNRAVMSPAAPPETKRTGIATGWGREIDSALNYGAFVRASEKPRALSLIRYNDEEGAEAMGVERWGERKGLPKAFDGLVEWGMVNRWGPLKSYWWRGNPFVIGKKGREYQLEVRNLSDARLEVVLSVDGLDVIDGQPASTGKRGYLIAPGQKLRVKGFRTSPKKVVTFEFSSVDQSYARRRHGNARNVGVVGLAVFTEKGREPGRENKLREGARAFAEAPPVRGR